MIDESTIIRLRIDTIYSEIECLLYMIGKQVTIAHGITIVDEAGIIE